MTFTITRPRVHINGLSPDSEAFSQQVKAFAPLFQPFIDALWKYAETGITAEALVRHACIRHGFNPFGAAQEPESHFVYAFIRENLVPHKIEVLKECMKVAAQMGINVLSILERAIVHDLSKLSNEELLTYSQIHHVGSVKEYLGWGGEFVPIDMDLDMAAQYQPRKKLDRTIFHHYHFNDHHPEHWIKNVGVYGESAEMPKLACYEMVADWAAASTTYGTPLKEWVDANFAKKPLHPSTRELVKEVLDRVYRVEIKD